MANSKALVWDASGEREFESGIKQVALYVQKDNGTYNNGVAWSGITGITENPGGADKTDLYADDKKYATLRAAETFGCTIEAFTFPDEWNACDGSKEIEGTITDEQSGLSTKVGLGIFVGQQARAPFGLVYKTSIGDDVHPSMDKGYKLHIVYNLTASPSSRGYSTINDNPDAITFSWEADSTPIEVNDDNLKLKALSTLTIDSTKADAAKLKALEKKLYGDTDQEPTLLTPVQVFTELGYTASGN